MTGHVCPTGRHPEPDHRCYRGHPHNNPCRCTDCTTLSANYQTQYRARKAETEDAA